MASTLQLPAGEVALGEVEANFIGFEPPGFFPSNQDSYFGTLRKVLCDMLQGVLDKMDEFYVNLGIQEADPSYLTLWEAEYGAPINPSNLTTDGRRALLLSRLQKGAFTRTRRDAIIWNYIQAHFGTPIILNPLGVELVAGGVPLYSELQDVIGGIQLLADVAPIWLESIQEGLILNPGGLDLGDILLFHSAIEGDVSGVPLLAGGLSLQGAALFNTLEHVSAFEYDVRILDSVTIDVIGLTRELEHATPAPITFTVTQTPNIYA